MNLRRVFSALLVSGGLLCLLASSYYFLDYLWEQRSLGDFLGTIPEARPGAEHLPLVEALTKRIGELPGGETTARVGYSNPLYDVLRARPIDVLRSGGFCGNKARLLIALLDLRSIPARLAYIYNDLGRIRPKLGQPYVTAFVEARVGDRWIVADPLLGLVFRNSEDQPATAAELAVAPVLVSRQGPTWYDPELFNYRELRGVRWAKFAGGETVRAVLARLISEEWANGIHYPSWAHRPNLLMAMAAIGVAGLLLPAGLWLRRSGFERTTGSGHPVRTCPV